MEQGKELLLQVPVHVNQEVAATDKVELGKWRIFDDILLGKDQHVADAFVDTVRAAVWFCRKKSGQPFRQDVCGNIGRIDAGAGRGNRPAVDVGSEYLHLETLLQRLYALLQEDGDGICLLAGGASL